MRTASSGRAPVLTCNGPRTAEVSDRLLERLAAARGHQAKTGGSVRPAVSRAARRTSYLGCRNIAQGVAQFDNPTSAMPVKKKRKSSSSDDSGKKKCKIASFPRPHAPIRLIHLDDQFSSKKCLSWFYEYAGPDKVLGPEDMEKFCEDISVEPENIIMLVLAWKLEAPNMGFFAKEEWIRGMTLLQCDCIECLGGELDYLLPTLHLQIHL
ncbi:hypothetical protein AGIG_G7713 [Arapaima gigas]